MLSDEGHFMFGISDQNKRSGPLCRRKSEFYLSRITAILHSSGKIQGGSFPDSRSPALFGKDLRRIVPEIPLTFISRERPFRKRSPNKKYSG